MRADINLGQRVCSKRTSVGFLVGWTHLPCCVGKPGKIGSNGDNLPALVNHEFCVGGIVCEHRCDNACVLCNRLYSFDGIQNLRLPNIPVCTV